MVLTDKFWGPLGAGECHRRRCTTGWQRPANALQDNSDTHGQGAAGGAGVWGPDAASRPSGPLRVPPLGHPGLREPQGEPPRPWPQGEVAPGQATLQERGRPPARASWWSGLCWAGPGGEGRAGWGCGLVA